LFIYVFNLCSIGCIKLLNTVSTNISIILPTYNSEKFIEECLKKLSNVINKKIELIIVNDNSSDNTKKICSNYVKKNKYIKLINLKKNSGVSIARNTGINYSKGKYLFFLDSDDLIIKKTLLKINKLIEDSIILDFAFFPSYDPINKIIDKNFLIYKKKDKKFINCIKDYKKFRLTCWNYFFNKDFLLKNNIKFSNIRIFEEQIFLTKIFIKAKKFKIFKMPFYQRRIFQINSLSSTIGYNLILSCIKNLNLLVELYIKKKQILNKNERNFIYSRFTFLIKEILKNLILLNKDQIKKISKKVINRYFFKKILFPNNILLKEFFHNDNINRFFFNKYNQEKEKIIKVFNKILNKKIIIYCAGSYSKIILKYVQNFRVKINFICDSNLGFKGQKIYKYKIKNKEYLSKNIQNFVMNDILILNSNINVSKNIKKNLIKIGFQKKKIYYLGH